MVGYVGSWKKRDAAVEESFQRMIFQSSNLLLLYDFNRFIRALCGQPFLFFGQNFNAFHIKEVFPFVGTWCKF